MFHGITVRLSHCLISFKEDYSATFVAGRKIVARLIELDCGDYVGWNKGSASSRTTLDICSTFCYVLDISFVSEASARGVSNVEDRRCATAFDVYFGGQRWKPWR